MAAKHATYKDDTGRELCRISAKLFTNARLWHSLNQELADIIYPMRADWTTELNLGDDFALDIVDSYPMQARAQLGDAIEPMLRPPGGKWFGLSSGDPDLDKRPENAKALDRINKLMRTAIGDRRTQFQKAMKEGDHDWVTFGCAVASWEESVERTHPVLKAHHPRDNAWLVNDDGMVDTNHRKLWMTARNIMARINSGRWKGTAHPDIKFAADKEPDREFEIHHCLMPMDDIYGSDKGKRRSLGNNAFVSIYYDVEHECTLSEYGKPFFNYVISRWRTLGTWPWGFSPVAIQTLPDARMAQSLAAMVLEQGEKALDPPIVGAGDVFRNDINLPAGGFTMADLADGRNLQDVMTVIDTAKNMPVGFEMRQDLRMMVAEGFLLTKLTLPNLREMTAYETQQRMDEYRRAALPFFTPIEAERHDPILSGLLLTSINMGFIDPRELPRELAGREVSWQFESPLNTAEGRAVAQAFRESVADVGAAMQIDPTVKDMFDFATAAMDAVRGNGGNPEWLLDADAAKARRDQNKQLMDANTAADALQKGAATAADVAAATQQVQQAGMLALPPPAA